MGQQQQQHQHQHQQQPQRRAAMGSRLLVLLLAGAAAIATTEAFVVVNPTSTAQRRPLLPQGRLPLKQQAPALRPSRGQVLSMVSPAELWQAYLGLIDTHPLITKVNTEYSKGPIDPISSLGC
jgi:hypothetical protein